MKIRLGYACISAIINTTSSKTTTLTYYKKLDTKSKQNKIDIIIKENLKSLKEIIIYNIKNNIHFFRITAKLIPLMDIVNIDLNKYKNEFLEIGNLINKNNMRVDVHADEFCVLNSINENVVLNSIKILNNVKKADLSSVLLTGCTGFLGIHILRDLLINDNVKQICSFGAY